MKSEMGKIKYKYEQIKKANTKQTCNDCAMIIVGFKILKHVVFKFPKAIEEKKKHQDTPQESSLYKNASVFDYLENPDFEFNKEVERVSDKIERNVERLNKGMKNIREKTSIFHWIKKLIIKIKNRNQKMLPEGEKEEELTQESGSENERLEFIKKLRSDISIDDIEGEKVTGNCDLIGTKIEENNYER